MVASLGRSGPLGGKRALIISKDDDSSKAVLRSCAKWIRLFRDLGIVGLEGEPTASEIRLDNGCQIVSIPGGRPEAARGASGSVWLDEFPYHRNQILNYQAAVGVTTLGGLVRIVSTPFSDMDLFWGIRKNVDNLYGSWGRHKTTIHDALAAVTP
jgi:phage FluMu gp28-like protein